MQLEQLIQTIALAAIPVLFAITLHEAAHGYVARHFGDMTAYQQGRISLNPLRHIDPVGTVLSQSPAAGEGILPRSPVDLVVSVRQDTPPAAERPVRAGEDTP